MAMKTIHYWLLVAIACMIGIAIWMHRSKEFMEGFVGAEEPAIVINAEHCGFMAKQLAGYQAELDAGIGSVANLSMMIDAIKGQMAATGCSGKEVEVGPPPIILTPPIPTNSSATDAVVESVAASSGTSDAINAAIRAAAASGAAGGAVSSAEVSEAINAAIKESSSA